METNSVDFLKKSVETKMQYDQLISIYDKEIIKQILIHTNYNLLKAAKIFKINRGTLLTKIKVYNITRFGD